MFKISLPKFSFDRLKKMNRNVLLVGSLATVLVIVGILAIVFRDNTAFREVADSISEKIGKVDSSPTMGARVVFQEGVVEYKTDGLWANVPKNLSLLPGMYLRTTGAASRATVELKDGSFIRLDANSELRFDTLSVERVVVNQLNGHIYHRVTQSSSRTFVVGTPSAQIQAVGTAFQTITSGDEESVEVYQNRIKNTTNDSTTDEGKKVFIRNMINSSKDGQTEDLEIETLKKNDFVMWNRKQDLAISEFKNLLGFLSDIEGPEITISSPIAGSTIEMDSSIFQGSVSIKGKTESKAKLTVQSKSLTGSKAINVEVSDDGSFTTGDLLAPIGDSVFEFVAIDATGNRTILSINYSFKRKTVIQEQGIALTATVINDKIKLEWGLVGMSTPGGVRLLKSDLDTDELTYPTNDLQWVTTGTSVELNVSDYTAGSTYYFKVCRYDAGTDSCDIYSDKVSITIPMVST